MTSRRQAGGAGEARSDRTGNRKNSSCRRSRAVSRGLEGSRNPGTGGVGLGLTIARDVIRGHGGEIRLDDSPNGGLRVRLKVPI